MGVLLFGLKMVKPIGDPQQPESLILFDFIITDS